MLNRHLNTVGGCEIGTLDCKDHKRQDKDLTKAPINFDLRGSSLTALCHLVTCPECSGGRGLANCLLAFVRHHKTLELTTSMCPYLTHFISGCNVFILILVPIKMDCRGPVPGCPRLVTEAGLAGVNIL